MTRTNFADWMPYYGDDFEGSEHVAVMDLAAEAIYHRALWLQWKNGSLPSDLRVLRALFPAKAQALFDEMWAQVAPFFEERGGRLYNARCESERSSAQAISERRSSAGRSGGMASANVRATAGKRPADAPSCPAQANVEQSSTTAQHPTGTWTETEPNNTPPTPPPGGKRASARRPKKPPRDPGSPDEEASGGGGKGTPLTRAWDELWLATRLGKPYGWSTPDGVAMAACAKMAKGDEQEVLRRMRVLLESSDPWLAENATPRILRSQWNRFAVEIKPLNAGQRTFLEGQQLLDSMRAEGAA